MLRILVERAGEIIHDSLAEKPLISIGRGAGNDVVLEDENVSSLHLVVKLASDGGGYQVIDQSANGTLLDGVSLAESTRIERPAIARIAEFEVTLIPLLEQGETADAAGFDLLATTDVDRIALAEMSVKRQSTTRRDAELRLRNRDGSHRSYVFSESAMIGRTGDCDIQLASPDVSRQHCHIFSSGESYLIRRLSNVNGVQVNGRDLESGETVRLSDGDVVVIGDYEIVFLTPATAPRGAVASNVAEARPNHDLVVTRRESVHPDVVTFEVIGFLGAKTFAKFETELLHEVRRLRNVILDLGYLIGVDAAGLASLGKVVREAAKSRTAIRLVRIAPRINDLLQGSPLSQMLLPYVSRSEESAVRVLSL